MSISVAIHDPVAVEVTHVTTEDKTFARLGFIDKDRQKVFVFTTPEFADAMADAFNRVIASPSEAAA